MILKQILGQRERLCPLEEHGQFRLRLKTKIYVLGGRISSTDALTTVEVYDSETDTWSTTRSMSTARVLFCAFTIGDRIYALDGASMESLQVVVSEEPTYPLNLTATGGNAVVELSWGAAS